jgi:hypothetical protein
MMKKLSIYLSQVLIDMAVAGELEGDITQVDTDKIMFKVFTKRVDELLLDTYGIGADDCTSKLELLQEFNDGAEAEHLVKHLGNKYDLIPTNSPTSL